MKSISMINNLSARERLVKYLLGGTVDRIPFMPFWGPWRDTAIRWKNEGMEKDNDWYDLFGFDPLLHTIPVNYGIWPYFEKKVLIDEGETIVHINEYGVMVRDRKQFDSMPQFIEHPVKDRGSWERFKHEHLQLDAPGRFPDNWPKLVREYANRDYPLVLGAYPFNGFFGTIRWFMGDEEMLIAMIEDSQFVYDINEYLCGLWHAIWERIFTEVHPDIIFFWEDMAGRQGSLISPVMFRKFMAPFYLRMIRLVHKYRIPIIMVDSDGFVEDLAPLFWEVGVNCLLPWEVQAGNRLDMVRQKCPHMAFMGGMDKRAMAKGPGAIDAEIKRIHGLLSLGRFVPFPDHAIPPDVSWANYKYFISCWRNTVFSYKLI
ncbi:MAG: hypothetical protein HY350_02155 [Candidatus Omnitrophica bacterium]|nr:hypothetical protein [Candidatus Omnitrophota bacterium]